MVAGTLAVTEKELQLIKEQGQDAQAALVACKTEVGVPFLVGLILTRIKTVTRRQGLRDTVTEQCCRRQMRTELLKDGLVLRVLAWRAWEAGPSLGDFKKQGCQVRVLCFVEHTSPTGPFG